MADWYYEKDGAQNGPVSEGEIAQLLAGQIIHPSTLLWRSGFADWQPLESVPEFTNSGSAGSGLSLQSPTASPSATAAQTAEPSADSYDIWREQNDRATVAEEKAIFENPFHKSFEFRFFMWTLLAAVIISIPLYILKNPLFITPGFLMGIVCILTGGIIFRVRTFQESAWWGLSGLIFGVTDLIFLFRHWDRAWRSFALFIMGFVVVGGMSFAIPLLEDMGYFEWL